MTQVGARYPAHVVSNEMVVEVVRSVIVTHRLRADSSLTAFVDDEKAYRERVEMLIGALAGLLPAIRASRLSPTQALWTL